MKILEGKVAIVTGGASGIGEAIVYKFIEEGAKVVIADVDEKAGNKLQEKVGNHSIFVKADSSSLKDNQKIVDQAIKHFGKLDIAVNNAGIGGEAAPVGENNPEMWDKVIDINLNGVYYGMHYQIPAMLKNGGGSIVNMASILGTVGTPNSAAYSAAKHGVVGLTKSAALEYGTQNIRINSIGPGYIQTPLLDKHLSKEQLDVLREMHAMKRLGKAEEVAELALWLASDKSSFSTGAYYLTDGGYTAQ